MGKFIRLTTVYRGNPMNETHMNIEKIVRVIEHPYDEPAATVIIGSGEDDYFQIDLESYKRLVEALYE